jgi:hypothetical protein
MSDALGTYLHDHLAGAKFAVDLLEHLEEQHRDNPLGVFASGLKAEIEEDVATLRTLADRVGAGAHPMREAAGWLGEKASRLKLRRPATNRLATFEALEVLALGILGKRALWNALAIIAPGDSRFAELGFERLAARAEDQHARVEAQRLAAAPHVFQSQSPT